MGLFKKVMLNHYYGKLLIIDIDGVLAAEQYTVPLEYRPVVEEARESMELLHRKGYRLLLCTSRIRSQRKATLAWLENNHIPFDDIVFGKPRGILYIDDRGYRFKNWKTFFEEVET